MYLRLLDFQCKIDLLTLHFLSNIENSNQNFYTLEPVFSISHRWRNSFEVGRGNLIVARNAEIYCLGVTQGPKSHGNWDYLRQILGGWGILAASPAFN